MDWVAWTCVVAAAGAASAINSVAGGGTFLTFPALTGLAGLTEKAANMTSTVGLWPGSAASIVAARAEFAGMPGGMVGLYGAISLAGGAAGALLLTWTKPATFTLVIPWLLLFATVVFGFSKPIARWRRKHGSRALKWTLLVAGVQFLIAVYGGYFGAGIGVLMLAGLSFAGLDHIHQMNALKVFLATLINGVATGIFVARSWGAGGTGGAAPGEGIDWPLAGGMVAAAVAGGFLGMHFSRKMKPDRLRVVILLIGVVLTGVYFYRAYGVRIFDF